MRKRELGKLERATVSDCATWEIVEILKGRLKYTNGLEFVELRAIMELLALITGQLAVWPGELSKQHGADGEIERS